jgi:hypothetical protein
MFSALFKCFSEHLILDKKMLRKIFWRIFKFFGELNLREKCFKKMFSEESRLFSENLILTKKILELIFWRNTKVFGELNLYPIK